MLNIVRALMNIQNIYFVTKREAHSKLFQKSGTTTFPFTAYALMDFRKRS